MQVKGMYLYFCHPGGLGHHFTDVSTDVLVAHLTALLLLTLFPTAQL